MRKRRFVLLNLVLVLSLILVSPASAKDTPKDLQPGEPITLEQKVPINLVFIGYPQKSIDKQQLLNVLPSSYVPVVRYPQFYGLPGRDMGLRFNFEYQVTFTENSFANKFFNYLQQIGVQGDLTDYQVAYNDQKKNVLEVTGPVLYIDAPTVEQWLASHLENKKGYTVVFINWYARPDFNFHVYTKTDQPDPDTGYNFGEIRETRKMIAWGGSHSRLWFYDLSAGPEAWTDNWNVDMPDLDENGVEDYRMPPIWEYTRGGYRKPAALSKDLGKVTRFVAINLLFTTSPLYDPMVTAPGVGGSRVVHVNMFEDDPNSLGTDWINTAEIQAELADFQPYYNWQVNLVDHNPIDERARRAFRIFTERQKLEGCWENFGTPFAQLFCFFDKNRETYIPAYGAEDYVLGIFAFNTTDTRLGTQYGLLGFADDNWVDGTQTYVFEFGTSGYRELGYGFTSTAVHEAGHHIGMSHPHDGYDSELGLDYGPADEFYYVWSGDESDTVMHYLGLSNGFGRFDRDNMYRYETAGYLNWSSMLLAEILAHPDAQQVEQNVTNAEAYAEEAIESFHNWEYLAAVTNARLAYEELAMAANQLGIVPSADESLLLVAPSMMAPHEGDPIRLPNN